MVIMTIESRSAPGESTAPAMNASTTAKRRNRLSSDGPITPNQDRMMITSGSSNEMPSASVTCITKLKYLSYVMNGAMASVWKLNSTRSAWGTTNR